MTAGLWARTMGLPIDLVAAVNENDVFATFVKTGELRTLPSVVRTKSFSMDIQVHKPTDTNQFFFQRTFVAFFLTFLF